MSKKDKQQKLWEDSLDMYAAAAGAAAEAWAEAKAEIETLQAANDRLKWEKDLLTRACEGVQKLRNKVISDNNRLKAENNELRADNQHLNELLDTIAASKNKELVAELYEMRAQVSA